MQNLFIKKQAINHSDKIKKIQAAFDVADAVIIGAGAVNGVNSNRYSNIRKYLYKFQQKR